MLEDTVTLRDCIPPRQLRTGQKSRINVGLPPDIHAAVKVVAAELNVSVPDAIETMVVYLQETGVVREVASDG